VQKKCNVIKGSMFKACRDCTDQPVVTARTSVDVDVGASLELVDNFCSLGDMLSIDGNADAAAEATVRKME